VSESCQFCDALPGEPCMNMITTLDEKYECPDNGCDQLYSTSHEALNCTMHVETVKT